MSDVQEKIVIENCFPETSPYFMSVKKRKMAKRNAIGALLISAKRNDHILAFVHKY
jgi:hypothetical protein